MEAKADEYREIKRISSLLLVAAARGYLADVETLVQQGADLNGRDKKNLTSLHFAAGRGWFDIVRFLWSKSADLDVENSIGCTPLYVASLNGRVDVVSFLLSKTAILNCEDADDNTPLHAAARGGHLAVVQLLLSHGAAINAKNKFGSTPGAVALLNGHVDVAKMLVAKGWSASERPGSYSLLHLAAGVGATEAVEWLLESGTNLVNDAENEEKATPLHCAAMSASYETVKAIVDAGGAVNVKDGGGRFPLDKIPLDAPVELATKLKTLLKPSGTASTTTTATTTATTTSTTSTAPLIVVSRAAAFRALSQQERLRKARVWSSFSPAELRDALKCYPGSKEIARRIAAVAELRRSLDILRAMASLRADEEFQQDMAVSEVLNAVLLLKKDPSAYPKLAGDRRVASVVEKMGRVHATVQRNGQRTFAIEDLIVPSTAAADDAQLRREDDVEKLRILERGMEWQLAAAVAAAAVEEEEEGKEDGGGSGGAEVAVAAAEAAFLMARDGDGSEEAERFKTILPRKQEKDTTTTTTSAAAAKAAEGKEERNEEAVGKSGIGWLALGVVALLVALGVWLVMVVMQSVRGNDEDVGDEVFDKIEL